MPFVRISLKGNRSEKERLSIGDCVHRALVKAIGIPEGDRFQVITEHNAELVYDPDYLNIHRTDGIIMIQITLASGRTVELKKALFKTVAEFLATERGFRKEDVFINLLETARENWSFGNGIAQHADGPPPHLARFENQK
jgi:phenylpyruvate tautomerase PptA (4-oxalocrotonate tautomerase family)